MGREMPPRVHSFPRAEFLTQRWRLRPGEHVTILAPTDWGKTTLALQLLSASATPKFPALNLVAKPKDPTVSRWSATSGFRTVRTWPPPLLTPRNIPGWTVWPEHVFDPARDNVTLYHAFRAAILHSYKKGNRIVFSDETHALVKLGLTEEIETILMRARSMGTSGIFATQRPAHIPLAAYSQASHLFLGRDPDKRATQRYSEIGGVDGDLIKSVTGSLTRFHWLYIKRHGRNGPELCVVEP